MVELKEKTVEELRKMASRKKIEGRSKMNKAQLVRALQKCTTIKKRKMKGGALNEDQVNMLVSRNYVQNPMIILSYTEAGRFHISYPFIQSIMRNGTNHIDIQLRGGSWLRNLHLDSMKIPVDNNDYLIYDCYYHRRNTVEPEQFRIHTLPLYAQLHPLTQQ